MPFILNGWAFICFILAFWVLISCHFGLFGVSFPFILAFWAFHFLLFWPFWLSFPFTLVFWAFISFHFGLLGLHFLFLTYSASISFHFSLLGLRFLSFWSFGPLFPFILPFSVLNFFSFLAFWAFGFFSFWALGLSFPFILALWAFKAFQIRKGGPLGGHRRVYVWGQRRKDGGASRQNLESLNVNRQP